MAQTDTILPAEGYGHLAFWELIVKIKHAISLIVLHALSSDAILY